MEAKNDLGLTFDYSRIISGVDLLLAEATEKATYVERVDKFLKSWMTGNNGARPAPGRPSPCRGSQARAPCVPCCDACRLLNCGCSPRLLQAACSTLRRAWP
jgi:hypothetical protein